MAQKENGSAQVDGRAEHTPFYGEKGINDRPEKGGKQGLALAAAHLFQGQGLHLGIGVQLGGLGVVGGKDIEISPAGDIFQMCIRDRPYPYAVASFEPVSHSHIPLYQ